MNKEFKVLYEGMINKLENKYNKELSLIEKRNLLEFLNKQKYNSNISHLDIIKKPNEIIKNSENTLAANGYPEDLEIMKSNIGIGFRSLEDDNIETHIKRELNEESYDEYLNLKQNKDFDGLTNFFIMNDIDDHSYYDPLFECQIFQFPYFYEFIKRNFRYEIKTQKFQVIPKKILLSIYAILLKAPSNPQILIKEFGLDKYSENTRNEIMDYFEHVYGLDRGLNYKNYISDFRRLRTNQYNTIFLYLI